MPAGDRFIDLPAEAMFAFLESKGFEVASNYSRSEVVYARRHDRDKRFVILVYTGIAPTSQYTGESFGSRGCGEDAIRVVPLFEQGYVTRGLMKTKRVYRTGSVEKILERTLERMREAYAVCNERIKKGF